jgi:hypothetical protein
MDLFPDPPWTCLDIRHKRLRPVPPCGLQQLGRPVWRIRHTTPDGPPWLADSGLRRWYTYLVYPQHMSSELWTLVHSLHIYYHLLQAVADLGENPWGGEATK